MLPAVDCVEFGAVPPGQEYVGGGLPTGFTL